MAATGTQDHAGVRVPPPLIFMGGLLAGAIIEWIVSSPNLPDVAAITAGLVGLVLAGWLAGSALRRFARAKTHAEPWKPSSSLVLTGPYRFTRNPMYLGMACLYSGVALLFGYLWAILLLPAVLFVIDRQVIAREERYLARRFGTGYLEYKERVRRWL